MRFVEMYTKRNCCSFLKKKHFTQSSKWFWPIQVGSVYSIKKVSFFLFIAGVLQLALRTKIISYCGFPPNYNPPLT